MLSGEVLVGKENYSEKNVAAPMFGGELVKVIGFPWLMRLIGLINILYTPLLLILAQAENQVRYD